MAAQDDPSGSSPASGRRTDRKPWWTRSALGFEAGNIALIDFMSRFSEIMKRDHGWLRVQVDAALEIENPAENIVTLRVDRDQLERLAYHLDLAAERAALLARLVAAGGERRRRAQCAYDERLKASASAVLGDKADL